MPGTRCSPAHWPRQHARFSRRHARFVVDGGVSAHTVTTNLACRRHSRCKHEGLPFRHVPSGRGRRNRTYMNAGAGNSAIGYSRHSVGDLKLQRIQLPLRRRSGPPLAPGFLRRLIAAADNVPAFGDVRTCFLMGTCRAGSRSAMIRSPRVLARNPVKLRHFIPRRARLIERRRLRPRRQLILAASAHLLELNVRAQRVGRKLV